MRADAVTKRAALVAAARRLFATDGPDVPLRTVAEEAGVGIGTLYRHFPNREDLILAVAAEIVDEVQGIARRAEQAWADDPERAWQDLAADLVNLRLGAFLPRLVAGREELVNSPRAAEERGRALAALERVLDRAREAGFIGREVSALRFHVGLASLTRPLPQVELIGLGDEEDWLVEVYLAGLQARA